MKTAISLPDPLFEAAEELAAQLAISRSQLYVRALEAFVLAHRDEAVTAALNRIYEAESSELDPVLASIQSASLSRDEW
jgi:antitoxin MazE6